MNGFDLSVQMRDLQARLNATLGEFGKWGKALAKAEYDYKTACSQEILKERTNGLPVTIIMDVCKGKSEIAKLRMNRDVAEVMFKAAGEHINAIKLEMRVVESAIEREWNAS